MRARLASIAASPLLRRYVGVLSVDVLVRASNILLLPVYLRVMSQAEFGLYGYVAAIVSAFSMVLGFGVYVAQGKLYHDQPESQRGSVLFTLNVLLATALLVALAGLFATGLDEILAQLLFREPIDYRSYRLPVLMGIVAAVYALLLSSFYLVSDAIARVQAYNLTRVVLVNAVVVAGLIAWSDADAVRLRLGVASLAELLILAWFARDYLRAMRPVFRPDIVRRAWRLALPVTVSAIVGIAINLGDRFFLERFGTRADLSVYNLGMTLAGIIPFVFASFQGVWLPQILRERDAQAAHARSHRMMGRMLLAFAGVSAAIELGTFVALEAGLIDEGYTRVLLLLPIALGSATVAAMSGMYTNLLLHADRLAVIVLAGVPVAAVGALLNLLLVPAFNVFGAAMSALAVNLLLLVCYRTAALRPARAIAAHSDDAR